MRLSTLFTIFGILLGLAIIGYDTYWYLILHHDPSQFLAFAMLGVLFIAGSIVAKLIYDRLQKIDGKMNYFEENLLDRFPKLRGK